MAKVSYTRINLFNTLVCPSEIESGEWNFKDWCTTLQNEEDYFSDRSYLLLDFYSAFRKVYNFFFASDVYANEGHIRKFYCSFSEDNREMVITVKYKKPKEIDKSFFDALELYFDVDINDSYDEFEMEPPGEAHNSLKLIFRKKG